MRRGFAQITMNVRKLITIKNMGNVRAGLLKALAFAVALNIQPITAYGDLELRDAVPLEPVIQDTSLVARTPFETGRRRITALATAYSSTPDQTDDTPFTTAANTRVRDGVVAANFLSFGTKVKIPALYGDKIFVVEDRMHSRYNGEYRLDIWFPDRASAKEFGARRAEIVIL